jgi:hypothetical protein
MHAPPSARAPGLNPYHPNHSRNTPSRVSEALWPGMSTGAPSASNRPMRGPSTQAAASEANPPTMCTGPSPAKSYTPASNTK